MNLSEPRGWIKDTKTGKYSPLWTLEPTASEACSQLAKCRCGSQDGVYSCKGRCTCKSVVNLPCTELCVCKGQCQYSLTFNGEQQDEMDTDCYEIEEDAVLDNLLEE